MKFLFTDIEGSTRLWERYGDIMGEALRQHDAILENEIGRWGGQIVKHTGDGIFAVFPAGRPLEFALNVQRQLREHDWGEIGELRVRYAIHAGEAQQRNGDYFGAVINRTTRLLDTSRGGQILLTAAVAKSSCVPFGASLHELGTYRLKDLSEPLQIFELSHPECATQPSLFSRLRLLHTRHLSLTSRLSAVRRLAHRFIARCHLIISFRAPCPAVPLGIFAENRIYFGRSGDNSRRIGVKLCGRGYSGMYTMNEAIKLGLSQETAENWLLPGGALVMVRASQWLKEETDDFSLEQQ